MKNKSSKKPNLKCPKCDYSWFSRSKNIYVTCPNCQRRFDRKESKIKGLFESNEVKTPENPKFTLKSDD